MFRLIVGEVKYVRLLYEGYLKPGNSRSRLYSDTSMHNYVYENEFLLKNVNVKR